MGNYTRETIIPNFLSFSYAFPHPNRIFFPKITVLKTDTNFEIRDFINSTVSNIQPSGIQYRALGKFPRLLIFFFLIYLYKNGIINAIMCTERNFTKNMSFNIVMVEPEIPQNTGNVARTCAVTGARLHLVGPMGFTIDDKKLKRAGLDYWHTLDITMYDNIDEFFARNEGGNFFFASTKSLNRYCDVEFKDGDYILFGKETKGLDEALLKENKEKCIRIPMGNNMRSLNLSNSVAIIIYEALRQNDFFDLETSGNLTKFEW